jgi:hypothetical protein
MIVTCLLLGVSGGIRFWREWQFQALTKQGAICPFPLRDLPTSLGNWQWIEGSESQLEREVAETAGSKDNDNILRDYADKEGGERVSVMVLYGLANTVFAHAPDVCYPGHGYRVVLPPQDRPIAVPGMTTPALCRSAIYAKKVGVAERYEVVYHAFLHNGQWLPEIASRWKSFRYHPGAFKIQLQRTVSSSGELTLEDGASEAFLSELIRQINQRVSAGQPGAAPEVTPARVASP